MSDIDYSEFLIKNTYQKEEKIVKPKKSRKKGFFSFVTIFLIVAIILLFIFNFFSKGQLISQVTGVFSKNMTQYYLVVDTYTDKNLAYANALKIQQLGGSGYIGIIDGKYHVVYSAHTIKTDALSVINKNPGTTQLNLSKKIKTDFDNCINTIILSLIDLTLDFDSGQKNEIMLSYEISVLLDSLDMQTDTLTTQEQSLLLLTKDMLFDINYNTNRLEIISSLRKNYSLLIFSFVDM